MSVTLYYFSATGNSLTTARILAEELGDCRLVPVSAVKDEAKVMETADTVGFVFPVYYGEMPYPVRELLGKMVFHPWTRHAEPQFQKLIDDGAAESDSQQVISLQLVNAPEEQQTCHDEQGFFTAMGDEGEEYIAQWCADTLQPV